MKNYIESFKVFALLLLIASGFLPVFSQNVSKDISLVEAKIIKTEKSNGHLKITVSISNNSNTDKFVSVNPRAFDGKIDSTLQIDEELRLFIPSLFQQQSERTCTKPFDVSGLNLQKIQPKTNTEIELKVPFPAVKIFPQCGFPKIVDLSKIETVSISFGVFDSEEGIEELIVKYKRLKGIELIDKGQNKGNNLLSLQKVVNLSAYFAPR